jgi:hypothetical protein
MFIKQSGLEHLLSLNSKSVRDDKTDVYCTWKELWDKHIHKIKHYSGNELDEIFGDKERVFDILSREVCSVFIRTYHHEIAFHIAVNGFPGSVSHDTLKGIDSGCAKLAGMLAKSHGVPLRSMKKEIDSFGYDNNTPLHVPIYYLMSVLRLADLLDADGNRAPKILSDMIKFSSLRSENEWTLNQLIENRQWSEQTGKPETLKIIADNDMIKTSIQYLELKSWFDYWQKELDLSWAVLGEMHGDKYKLSIRRITSNIFEKEYDFVTDEIVLKVNPDIVKHLVAPLYGDDPSYGVRELLQNAIDACNERTAIDGTVGEITVEVDKDTGIFRITDNGIGMNEDVISNYYLSAGSSYRYSKRWSETFTDDTNNPKIARSGRFGIGALATFLIGNKAKVLTRHINDDKGYYFEYTIEPNILNVKKEDKPTPGTTIEIIMNRNAIGVLTESFDTSWTECYHLTTPTIIYKQNGTVLEKGELYNLKKDEDSEGWFSYKSNDYDSFHWTLVNYISGSFVCNGIHIPLARYSNRYSSLGPSLISRGYYHIEPDIAVMDKKGIFPLDLARKIVFNTFELEDGIVAELCKYYIAKILVEGKTESCIINKRGFIPRERSFALNTAQPIYLIGKASGTFEVLSNVSHDDLAIAFFKAVYKIYANNIKDTIIGDVLTDKKTVREIWVNSSIIEIPRTVNYLPPKDTIHYIDKFGKWYDTFPISSTVVGENVNLVVKYTPSPIEEDENNIMFKTIQ